MKSSLYLENDYNMLQKAKSPEPEMKLNNTINENIQLFNRETLKLELQKIEEEIVTLKQVLSEKLKSADDLRHQLQLSFVNEKDGESINDVNSIKESNNYKDASITEDCKEVTLSDVSSISTVSQKIPMIKIANINKSLEEVKNAYISMQKIPCKFNPGEKIFAKVKGFVYWPARVNPLPPDIIIPANKIPIFFYGTHEVYFISPTSCWPYDEKNKNKWGKPKSRAHFNQGMTEIENYPTIYQYGVDPTAEEFLAQFYQFKKSNGENVILKSVDKDQSNDNSVHSDVSSEKEKRGKKTMNKKQSKSGLFMSVKENKGEEQKFDKDSTRKRHLSDSDLSGKNSLNESLIENSDIEQTGATINKRHKSDENSLEFMKKSISIKKQETIVKSTSISEPEMNNSEIESVKQDALIFKLSEDDEKVEDKNELKLELENNINDLLLITDSLKDAPLDNYCLFSVKPTTRCRIKSNNSLNNKSTLADSKSNNDSDSLSVDSDNPADEDFRPVIKAKRSNKNIKPQKIVKKISKRNTRQTTKKATPRSRLSVDLKIKNTLKDDLADSLSSISSIEDYKTVDNTQKGFEEKIDLFQLQDEKMEKLILKESISKVYENLLAEPIIMKVEISDTSESTIPKDTNNAPDQSNSISKLIDKPKDELCDLNNEAFIDVFKIDIIGEENVKVGKSEFSVVEKENCSLQDSNYSEKVNSKLVKPGTFIIDELGSESPKKIHTKLFPLPIPNVEEEDLIVSDLSNKQSEKEVDSITEEEIIKLKINLKEIKASNNLQKHNKSPKQNNRKRNRKLSSSSSSSSSESSKSENLKSKFKRNKLTERNSESENNKIEIDMNEKSSLSKIQILQNFNADIRSSLILGREDYKTCLERFKSLCEMQINLVSLVKVWQLMDTVKKCRRYKRNEQVKQEAQSVYRRFMEIYSQASKEEINTAQSLLMKYRHQNNVQNQNVGVDSNKINGGLVHGLTMPISVADMFQNKSFQPDSKLSKSIIDLTSEKVSCVNKSSPAISNPSQPTEVQINEEKMRLLSMDLEAKVSDILNKIEKNADVNPINQRSLSHLLPTTDENSVINLPVHWKTVSDKLQIDRDKIEEGEITDDDDDDVDAIVRRIEEVDIKFPESELISMNVINTITSSSNPSALDARIENLINNSFISNKEPRFKKSRTSSSRHHKNIAKNSSPLVLSISKPDQHKVVASSEIPVSVKPVTSVTTLYKERPMHFISDQEEQKDDIEIYDLLGV